ncbi:MAG: ATP-binding domain-containing protein, partial [Alistipes sp.]|nr:ATP-binding domain-containing protein [Candidatus Minthomonas equi]
SARIRSSNASYDSFAILYRTNAQSRAVEEALRKRNLPYRIFAGHSFYERQEIKDVMAYLRIMTNHNDDESLKRIINFPPRGIGDTTLGRLYQAAREWQISIWDTIHRDELSQFGIKDATLRKLRSFCDMLTSIERETAGKDAYSTSIDLINSSGVIQSLRADTSIEGQGRVANVEELLNSIYEFVEEQTRLAEESGAENPVITLTDYLENVALMTDYEAAEKKDDRNRISLMTVHSSKGLEFPYVYIIGMEEKMFPSTMCMDSEKDIEEERRLFYVALTRAEKAVSVSFARSRMKWGERVTNPPSRFLYEIDQRYLSQSIKSAANYGNSVDDDDFRPVHNHTSFIPMAQRSAKKGSDNTSGKPMPLPSFSNPVHKASAGFSPDAPSKLAVGQRIEHERFGYGKAISKEGSGPMMKVVVDFELGGNKTLLVKYAKIRIVSF